MVWSKLERVGSVSHVWVLRWFASRVDGRRLGLERQSQATFTIVLVPLQKGVLYTYVMAVHIIFMILSLLPAAKSTSKVRGIATICRKPSS